MSEAIAIKVTRYQCPHCSRTRAKKSSAEAHIARCFRNPAAHGCITCAYFQPSEDGDYLTGYPGCSERCGEGVDLSSGLNIHCEKWEAIY